MNYYHPNKHNEEFLAIDWLSKLLFKLIDADTLYSILIRILLEQSFIFISDDIQSLTILVLGFSYMIKPFKWPFILIPNLPLDLINMVESPVPFLLGILGDTNLKESFLSNKNIVANIAIHSNSDFKGELELILQDKLNCEEPYLKNLKNIISKNLSMAQYYSKSKKIEDFEKYCEIIYKNVYETFKCEIADVVEKNIGSNYNLSISDNMTNNNTFEISVIHSDNLNQNFESLIIGENNQNNSLNNNVNFNSFIINNAKNNFLSCFDNKDKSFAIAFSQTQIFQCFCEEVIKKQIENLECEYL